MVIIFLSIISLLLMPAAHADSKDDEYSQVLYKAWSNYLAYSTPNNSISIKVHASSNVSQAAINSFSDGAKWTLSRFGAKFSSTDTFHLIFASSYADAQKLSLEVNSELPNYDTYNTRHLSVAKSYFDSPDNSTPAGGTSSRGCNYDGSPYGSFQGVIKPCPALSGGAIYVFGTSNAFGNNFSNLFTIGAHEAFHLVLTKMNPNSHYDVPEWIIEGVCQSIGLTAASTDSNKFKDGTMLNPSPSLDPSTQSNPYDLTLLENQQGKPERFAIGILASDLLLSRSDLQTLFKFLSSMNNPNAWDVEFEKTFGFSKSIFYQDFKNFHSWYYSKGMKIIRGKQFPSLLSSSSTTKSTTKDNVKIICVKGKLTKAVSGTNPRCPAGYKVKA